MKQIISKQMDGGHNAQQFAVDLELIVVQKTLYDYMDGLPLADIFEVQEN